MRALELLDAFDKEYGEYRRGKDDCALSMGVRRLYICRTDDRRVVVSWWISKKGVLELSEDLHVRERDEEVPYEKMCQWLFQGLGNGC